MKEQRAESRKRSEGRENIRDLRAQGKILILAKLALFFCK
jgi:hypothetical protein